MHPVHSHAVLNFLLSPTVLLIYIHPGQFLYSTYSVDIRSPHPKQFIPILLTPKIHSLSSLSVPILSIPTLLINTHTVNSKI